MSTIGTVNSSNAALITDDYAGRLKERRTADAVSTANPGEAGVSSQTSPSYANGFQAGIQLTGAQDQEFRPYDATGLPKKINTGADSELRAGEAGRQGNGSAAVEDAQQAKTPDSQPAVPGEKDLDDPQVQQAVARLRSTEEKVKAHEAAHKAAGGAMTGPVSYSYTRGPDGKNYITGGEVPINVSPGRTPQETISRMQQVMRAALAPADPSPQDRAVAAQAATTAQNARQQEAEAETESQLAESSGATTAATSDAAIADAINQIEAKRDNSDGTGRVAGKSRSGEPAPSFQPDAASWPMVSGEGRPASETTNSGLLGLISRQAYSDPAVAGSKESNGKYPAATRQDGISSAAGEYAAYGNASSRTGVLVPAQATGFGSVRPVSFKV